MLQAYRLEMLVGQFRRLLGCAYTVGPAPADMLEKHIKMLCGALERMEAECTELGLNVAAFDAHELRGYLLTPPLWIEAHPDPTRIQLEVNNLLKHMEIELGGHIFLYVPDFDRELWGNREPFGKAVWKAFADAIDDAEEAGKCLALDRGTACVFHCMRVTERGLRKLFDSFGAHNWGIDGQRTWADYINWFFERSKRADENLPPRWRGKQARLREIAQSLDMVRMATRNPTIHVERTYTLEHARDVFTQTGILMRRIAEELDEDESNGRECKEE